MEKLRRILLDSPVTGPGVSPEILVTTTCLGSYRNTFSGSSLVTTTSAIMNHWIT